MQWNEGLLESAGRRNSRTNRFLSSRIFQNILSVLPPALIPPIHIGVVYYLWHGYSRRVDKKYCSCSCWDTVFKGPYERGVGSFKHFYFNATGNTTKIWITTVLTIIAFYEAVKWLVNLGMKNQLRYTMLILFSAAVFSHYYAWWMYINYWNDDFYKQWNHQTYFTITELFSSWSVLQLADSLKPFNRKRAFFIVGIAAMHVIAGGCDQFVANVIKGLGRPHQVLRDVGFMVSDVLHIIVPLIELWKCGSGSNQRRLLQDLVKTALLVLCGLLVFWFL